MSAEVAEKLILEQPEKSEFDPKDWQILSKAWHPVGWAKDVTTTPKRVVLMDVALAIYRDASGAIHLVRDLCTHRGVPLSKGWVEGEQIVCPYHGLHFNGAGHCTLIPAQPDMAKIPKSFDLTVLPVVEKYGLVWTSLNSRDVSEANFPVLDTWDDPAHQSIEPPYTDIAGSSGRQLEGFIDVAHFAWVHHKAFADRNNAVVPKYKTERTDYGFTSEYISNVSNYPHGLQHLAPEGFLWRRYFEVYPPFSAVLTVNFPNDGVLKILNTCQPVSAHQTRMFAPLTRNFDQTGSLEDVYAFNAQIFAEDQAMVEVQKPEELPLDMTKEAHFEADRSSVMYRRILAEMGLSRRYIV